MRLNENGLLACARIGAIHSVVYAGLGHTALRDRIMDAGAKVVIAGELGYRRGKPRIGALEAHVDYVAVADPLHVQAVPEWSE